MHFFNKIGQAFGLIITGRFDYLLYRINTRLKGLNLDYVSLDHLGLSTDRSQYHSESGGPYLKKVLKTLTIRETSKALDLGSGKGGAVLTLSRFPFSEIVGVEISDSLVRIAQDNIAKCRLKNVQFVRCDAGAFTDLDRFTHIYMYNPFPQAVMEEVMINLSRSLQRNPRILTLIYCNPACHTTIMNSRLFPGYRHVKYPYSHDFHIYTSEISHV
jgi:protein-L-isoaspartate O-methyltransferase